MNIFLLEKKLLPHERWESELPSNIKKKLDEFLNETVPSAVGWDREIGWFIIQSEAQGPILIWSEYSEYKVKE